MITVDQKNYIIAQIQALLDYDSNGATAYWSNEPQKEPDKPYVFLTNASDEMDTPVMDCEGEVIRTYTAIFTVGIYFSKPAINAIDNNNKAITLVDYLQGLLLSRPYTDNFYDEGLAVDSRSVSPVRDLTDIEEKGTTFRYEFDLTMTYNRTNTYEVFEGEAVHIDMPYNDIDITIRED